MARKATPLQPEPESAGALESRLAFATTIEARAYRDAWCREYIKHFDYAKACHALDETGQLSVQAAKQKGAALLRDPYVIKRVDEITKSIRPEDVVTRGQVMSAMWAEACNPDNEGGTRVAALAHIAKMLGMSQPQETKTVHVGVMMVPMMDPASWQAAALAEQTKLKSEVRQVTIDGGITPMPMAPMAQQALP